MCALIQIVTIITNVPLERLLTTYFKLSQQEVFYTVKSFVDIFIHLKLSLKDNFSQRLQDQ